MSLYTFGGAGFTLENEKGKKLAKVNGKVKNRYPLQLRNPLKGSAWGYPQYEIVVVNGTTEIIEQRRMEPVFYVNDDPAVRSEILESCRPREKK